jgi:hypothetical protein
MDYVGSIIGSTIVDILFGSLKECIHFPSIRIPRAFLARHFEHPSQKGLSQLGSTHRTSIGI